MSPRPRSIFAALAAASLLAITAGCGSSGSDAAADGELASIVVAEQGKAGLTTGAVAYLADELGYFKEEGLEIKEYVEVTKGSDAISGMLSGAVQVSHIGADGIVAASQGGGVVGIAANTDASIWTVVASADVKSWDDLKGKTIALGSTSDITRPVFDSLAEQAGLDPQEDLEYVALGATPQRIAAVSNGQAAATIATYPSAQTVIETGLTDLGFAPEGGTPPRLMTTDIEASKAWTEEHPDQVVGYLRAIAKARDYMKDPANADDVAQRINAISDQPVDAVKVALEMYFYDQPAESGLYVDDFHHTEGSFDATVKEYLELGLIKKSITEEEYMDYSFADEALKGLS